MRVIGLNKFLKIFAALLFLTGAALVGYSLFQIWDGKQKVEAKKEEAKELIDKKQITVNGKKVPAESIDVNKLAFNKGDTIGLLLVPKLNKELPIVEGTDEDDLERGVGHYEGTALPLQNDQIVLSGHRDTVFRQFDQLEIGDSFILELPYGSFEYQIYDTEIVDADDTSVIRSTAPEEILTVTTCYPFRYIGNAPERFIFYAKPVYKKNG
ncbi:hypothetical protein B4135_1467 [Caldibacillus debilis]|uniref:Class D sortase n=1 Tax=Caldibacillus debilis TaxID=301148 RepID=A0A150MCY2_9BACI|nr:hypothetical protein B4135_1467 [Caldibacillus debilis]OUM89348.1 MAG: class D sortase [Caldibacillus debilis]